MCCFSSDGDWHDRMANWKMTSKFPSPEQLGKTIRFTIIPLMPIHYVSYEDISYEKSHTRFDYESSSRGVLITFNHWFSARRGAHDILMLFAAGEVQWSSTVFVSSIDVDSLRQFARPSQYTCANKRCEKCNPCKNCCHRFLWYNLQYIYILYLWYCTVTKWIVIVCS